jgi:hypothetical protein
MRIVAVCSVALAAVLGPEVLAWAPESRMAIADEAVRLMPESLRLALDMHRVDLMTGVLDPLREEDAPAHRAPWSGGSLDASLAHEAETLVHQLAVRTPFRDLAAQFGHLAHYAMDAGFPPGVGETQDDRRYAHFAKFCESRRPKFPLVFYGHDDPALAKGDWREFARAVMRRSRADDRLLAQAYAQAGDPPAPSAFDDRSIPFAVGSLSYSRSVNDVVRVWLAAWDAAGGDAGRTPFRKAPPRKE